MPAKSISRSRARSCRANKLPLRSAGTPQGCRPQPKQKDVNVPELKNSTRPEAIVIIRNIKGLHARASAKFVKCAESYNADVTVTREGQAVGGTSIMGLMMLAAGPGSELHLAASGPQAPEALQALVALVEAGFDEDCVGDA